MAAMWMQDPNSLSSGNSTLLMIFVAIVALAMSVQAIAVVAVAIGAAKARKRGLEIADEVRAKAMPLVHDVHELVRDVTPKMKVIMDNLVETSHTVRSKAQELDATATDLNAKTRAQAARIDGIVTSVLNTTTEVADTIQRGIKVPLREISGIVNGFKAGIDVLVGRSKHFGNMSDRTKPGNDPGW